MSMLSNIRRWTRMLIGKSIDHVNQSKGKYFIPDSISGYYNNLTEKVTKNSISIDNVDLPTVTTENGNKVYFPVAIFQYGLGLYDLYLKTNDKKYLDKFLICVKWAIDHIDEEGRWNNFFFYKPETPYGAMAQGEGVSLLLRAYKVTGNNRYLEASKKAIDFMILPIEHGGTTKYDNGNAYLMEYTFKGMVLNGAIFAWWGLYDYVIATKDTGVYKHTLELTLDSLIKILPKFKCSYWSMYSLDGLIASPFYHNLHIAQMEAMFDLTQIPIFSEYAIRWKKQQSNPLCKSMAFIRKAAQKIKE